MIRPLAPLTRCGDLTFHASGRIDITAHLSELLHLCDGDILSIAVSDDIVREYYLYVAHRKGDTTGRHTCRCHSVKGAGRYMRMFSKSLSAYLLRSAHGADKVTFIAGELKLIPGIGNAVTLVRKN